MTTPLPARLAKLLPLLASDKPGEVVATAAAIGRTLAAAGQDWHALAAVVTLHAGKSGGADRLPHFTFAALAPRTARKTLALLAGRPGVTAQQRGAMESLRSRLSGARSNVRLSAAEAAWLDALWLRCFGETRA